MKRATPTVLVVGGGGREHALALALRKAPSRPRVVVAPGNVGMVRDVETRPEARSLQAWVEEARAADLVVVGPEAPLAAGLVDRLHSEHIAALGPHSHAARLESSKGFAKEVMAEAGVPTARGARFDRAEPALAFARSLGRAVIKADGLAAGKGVVLPETDAEMEAAVRRLLDGAFGEASRQIVVEERLEGEELSVLALCDGRTAALMPSAQDHKRVFEDDQGPNTGGMGAYSPTPVASEALLAEVLDRAVRPVVDLMARRGTPFVGVLYVGVMVTADGPKVLEYNVRFGDPEAQAILPRLAEDPYELFLAAAKGELAPTPLRFAPHAAANVVMAAAGYPDNPRTGDPIAGVEDAEASGATVYWAGVREESGRRVTAGGRVLSVTGMGPTLSDALNQAYQGVERIHFDGAHFRRDIGARAVRREE
ncbi:MAG: phosphoribosylamine--glycine ligase [Myxococcota bacterium]